MKMLKVIIISFLVLFISHSTFAQKDKDKDKSDVQIIDFGKDDNNETSSKEYNGLIIKTNPISFIFGAQWIDVEKELTDYLSLQAGVGVTFNSLTNYSYDDLVSEISEESTCPDLDPCDDYLDYGIRTTKVGPYFSLSPRFFYESEGFEGAYIAPVFRFTSIRYEVQKVLEGDNNLTRDIDSFQSESVKNIDFMIHYGYQYLHPKLTTEWFIGLGARTKRSKRQDIFVDGLGEYNNGTVNFKDTFLRLEVGARVGFQL